MKSANPSFVCANCVRALRTQSQSQITAVRTFTDKTPPRGTTSPSHQSPRLHHDQPRWKQTPVAMKMPIRLRPQPKQPTWSVNTNEKRLNQAYDLFLGKNGSSMLDEETKWLAVTHKSHDHGRQGFNDRLAYFGKRIVDLQASLALLAMPSPPSLHLDPAEAFVHPALVGLENVTPLAKQTVLDHTRLAQLAVRKYGLEKVVRWKPRKSDNLETSGMSAVLAHTLYSIIGAVALRQGGEVAAKTARERILRPLGLTV